MGEERSASDVARGWLDDNLPNSAPERREFLAPRLTALIERERAAAKVEAERQEAAMAAQLVVAAETNARLRGLAEAAEARCAMLTEALRHWVAVLSDFPDTPIIECDEEVESTEQALAASPTEWLEKHDAEVVAPIAAVVAGFCDAVESAEAHHAEVRSGSKGQHVPFHGDFRSANPMVMKRLLWWVREMRTAIAARRKEKP